METNMNNELKNKSISDILEASSMDLYEWYLINFQKEIPRSDEIDLLEIGNLLSEVGNYFTYFSSMHSILDSMVKEMKLHKESSDKCKELMIKRDILGTFEEQSKFTYNAISRICTMKIEANNELKMLGHQC